MAEEVVTPSDSDVLDNVFSSNRDRGAEAPMRESEQPRNDRGQFAPKAQDPPPPALQEQVTTAPEQPQPDVPSDNNRQIPFATFEAERRKFKEREAKIRDELESKFTTEIQQLRQQMQRFSQPPQPQQPPPDFYQDPDGAIRHHLSQLDSQWRNQFLHQSERSARRSYGNDVVDAAYQAASKLGIATDFANGTDPWDDLVQWHKKQLALERVGTDPDAFEKRIREEERQRVLAELKSGGAGTGSAPPQPTRFPTSLASATPTGDQGAMLTDEDMMSNVFGSRRVTRMRR